MSESELYCYVYTYTNSLTGKVFYVGRGSGERYLDHLRKALRETKNPTRVVVAIYAIWQQSGKVIIIKVKNNMPYQESVDLEQDLISQYGYDQLVNLPHYKTWRWSLVKDVTSVLGIEERMSA